MTMRDLNNAIKVVTTIEPAASITATTTGAAVDTAGYRSAVAVIHCGVHTDGTFTPELQESDASGSGFTTVAAADLSGSFTAVISTNDQSIQEVGYLGSKRYLKVVMTETVASAGAFFTAVIVLGNPVTAPAA